jgi:hypothetical protein
MNNAVSIVERMSVFETASLLKCKYHLAKRHGYILYAETRFIY